MKIFGRALNQWLVNLMVLSLGAWSTACVKPGAEDKAPQPEATNPPVGVVDDGAGFYVHAQVNPNYKYYSHRGLESGTTGATYAGSFDWTQECVAAVGDDIMCYVEAAEYDLYFNGLVLQHNVPSKMCTYVEIEMPWTLRYPAGKGPNYASYENNTNNGVTKIIDKVNTSAGKPYCPFDYSGSEGRPNCCEGTYTLDVTTVVVPAPTGAPAAPTPPKFASWGGSRTNCMAGPAIDIQHKDKTGMPLADVYYVSGAGVNGVYTIDAPIKKLVPNLYAANYFDIAAGKTYSNLDPLTDYPPAFSPLANPYVARTTPFLIPGSDDGTGTSTSIPMGAFSADPVFGQPFYKYTCFNNYREVISRIRVMVRSWDVAGRLDLPATTAYTPNYAIEGGVGGLDRFHDFGTWSDLFFNYTNGASQSLPNGLIRQSFANTGGGSCTGATYPCQVGYSNPFTSTVGSGFPGPAY